VGTAKAEVTADTVVAPKIVINVILKFGLNEITISRTVKLFLPVKNHFWAEEDVLDWKKQFHGSTYGDLIETKLKYDIDNYLWCHNCVGSDFRLSCPHKDMKYGSLLSGYVSDSRYMMTKGREQASDHKARQPYIRQMSIP
jgi:hypothetical protein